MRTRPFDPEVDYETLCSWWKGWHWPQMPLEIFPKLGLVVEASRPLAMGFLYRTDSAIAWLAWPTGDPRAEGVIRAAAVDLLLRRLVKLAEAQGFGLVFTTSQHPAIAERLERLKFLKGDTNVSHYMLNLAERGA